MMVSWIWVLLMILIEIDRYLGIFVGIADKLTYYPMDFGGITFFFP